MAFYRTQNCSWLFICMAQSQNRKIKLWLEEVKSVTMATNIRDLGRRRTWWFAWSSDRTFLVVSCFASCRLSSSKHKPCKQNFSFPHKPRVKFFIMFVYLFANTDNSLKHVTVHVLPHIPGRPHQMQPFDAAMLVQTCQEINKQRCI